MLKMCGGGGILKLAVKIGRFKGIIHPEINILSFSQPLSCFKLVTDWEIQQNAHAALFH